MRSLLRKKRKKLAEANSISEYLKYAFGEVVLVVIGILIALSINNWNNSRIKNNRLESIAMQVVHDLESDTAQVRQIIDAFEPLEDTFLQIIGDSLSLEQLKECSSCGSLVAVIFPFTANDAGYNLLKNLDSELHTKKDSLVMLTKQFYGQFKPFIEVVDKMIQEVTKSNFNDWKNRETWFAEWIIGEADERFYGYMKTQDYRNRVAQSYLLHYQNNLPMLESYSKQAKELANGWREELGMEINKDEETETKELETKELNPSGPAPEE